VSGIDNGWPGFVAAIAPGVTLVLVAVMAALPPHGIMRRSRRGRARSAIAYLSGLVVGLITTTVLSAVLGSFVDDNRALVSAGVLASFFAPFAGAAKALWSRNSAKPGRRRVVT